MMRVAAIVRIGRRNQRRALFRYILAIAAMSLIWEFSQMPLYTLGQNGTTGAIIYSALHCTFGDTMIGSFALVAAILAVGGELWAGSRWIQVLSATVLFAVGYTIFSEWWNLEVRGSWAYTERMPVVPGLGTGLVPLLQWMVIPTGAFFFAGLAPRSALAAPDIGGGEPPGKMKFAQRLSCSAKWSGRLPADMRKSTEPKEPENVKSHANNQATGAER